MMRLFGLRPLFHETESGLRSRDKLPVSRYLGGTVDRKVITTFRGAQQREKPAMHVPHLAPANAPGFF